MAYYDALIAKWATLSGETADKLAAVNALTVAGPTVDVPVALVEGELSISGTLTAIEDWIVANPTPSVARTAGNELLRTMASPHITTFQMSNPSVAAAMAASLGVLAALEPPLLTQAQVTALIGLSQSAIAWWQAPVADGGGGLNSPVSENDLDAAGGLT